MRRLLVLACSERKRAERRPIAAVERYDGPAFRVLRRYCREANDRGLIVYILSAKYGLIASAKRILAYNQRMTRDRADTLRASVTASAQVVITRDRPVKVLVCAGKTYLRAIGRLHGANISFAAGGQGGKLASLKAWLSER